MVKQVSEWGDVTTTIWLTPGNDRAVLSQGGEGEVSCRDRLHSPVQLGLSECIRMSSKLRFAPRDDLAIISQCTEGKLRWHQLLDSIQLLFNCACISTKASIAPDDHLPFFVFRTREVLKVRGVQAAMDDCGQD